MPICRAKHVQARFSCLLLAALAAVISPAAQAQERPVGTRFAANCRGPGHGSDNQAGYFNIAPNVAADGTVSAYWLQFTAELEPSVQSRLAERGYIANNVLIPSSVTVMLSPGDVPIEVSYQNSVLSPSGTHVVQLEAALPKASFDYLLSEAGREERRQWLLSLKSGSQLGNPALGGGGRFASVDLSPARMERALISHRTCIAMQAPAPATAANRAAAPIQAADEYLNRIVGRGYQQVIPLIPAGVTSLRDFSARLSIGADGRVQSCSVASSSGVGAIDQLLCRNISRSIGFTPQTDSQGVPTSGAYTYNVTFPPIAVRYTD